MTEIEMNLSELAKLQNRAAEIMNRLQKVGERYTSQWEKSEKPEFRAAAETVSHLLTHLHVICENTPVPFVREWEGALDAPEIGVIHRLLIEAKARKEGAT